MRVRLLGTSAGGGFPQWNCKCANCRDVRVGAAGMVRRTQSCVVVSADCSTWFLINASPDVASQIEAFPALAPRGAGARGTGIAGILVTNADLDHTLGLFQLREDNPLHVYSTNSVRGALCDGLHLDSVLSTYCGIEWHEAETRPCPLRLANAKPSGLTYTAVLLPGKPPRYREAVALPDAGDCAGYLIEDGATGGRLLVMPDVAALNPASSAALANCDAVLMDGTFWSNDEMMTAGVGTSTASRMGHWPIGGPDGSLNLLKSLPIRRKIYTHINNTNPILRPTSPEHAAVIAGGLEVGYDGLEFDV